MNGINLLDGWFQFPVGDAAFYAIFGFMFVFLGITLLIVILTCLGKGMDAWRGRKRKQPKADKETAALPEATQEEGVSPPSNRGDHGGDCGVYRRAGKQVRFYRKKNQENLRRS